MSRFNNDARNGLENDITPSPDSGSLNETVVDQPAAHVKKTETHTAEHYDEKPNYGKNHTHEVAAKLTNPFEGFSEEEVLRDVDTFVDEKGLGEYREEFHKGALLARVFQQPTGFETVKAISEEERDTLRMEVTNRWRQPFQLYFLAVLCAGSAIVQGMDQTAVNGAQQFYFDEFNIGADQVYIRGLLNGAPYLCSALIGCWLNAPLNKWLGRRGTIFVSCFISFAASFWMAAADSWYNLLIARFALGLAVGAKSSTTPVYSAECSPKSIRGALGCQWQMWTAFGIVSSVHVEGDGADMVDAGFYRIGRLPECHRTESRRSWTPSKRPRIRIPTMAMDAGIDCHPTHGRHGSGILLPGVTTMVHGTRPIRQGIQVFCSTTKLARSGFEGYVLRLQIARD